LIDLSSGYLIAAVARSPSLSVFLFTPIA